jgi:hypothetical protein
MVAGEKSGSSARKGGIVAAFSSGARGHLNLPPGIDCLALTLRSIPSLSATVIVCESRDPYSASSSGVQMNTSTIGLVLRVAAIIPLIVGLGAWLGFDPMICL